MTTIRQAADQLAQALRALVLEFRYVEGPDEHDAGIKALAAYDSAVNNDEADDPDALDIETIAATLEELGTTEGYDEDDLAWAKRQACLLRHSTCTHQGSDDARVEELERELAAWKESVSDADSPLCDNRNVSVWIQERVAELLEKKDG